MIRDVTPQDYEGCKSVVDCVWKVKAIFHPDELADMFLDFYTIGSLAGSNFAVVAEENNRIVGFLFGKTKSGPDYRTWYSGFFGHFKLLFYLLCIKKVAFKKKVNIVKMYGQHEKNRLKAEPLQEYEVNLFAVNPNMQGKGIGKKLMNLFINKCRNDGVTRITLETDEECNFKFYEHFGFKKIAEFYSPIQFLYTGKTGTCFVYELNIA